jgi:transposase
LKRALEPMMSRIESVSERICEYDHLLESMTRNKYPEAERLKQIKGVGTLIALTYMLTLEDPRRFRKSRDAACYVGLQPGRRNSGQSEPQMHISKEGDPYYEHSWCRLRTTFSAPWGVDSDLRRWGMKLAEHGGKRGKKRAVIAAARKLAVLLHRLWVSGDVYMPLRPGGRATLPAVA